MTEYSYLPPHEEEHEYFELNDLLDFATIGMAVHGLQVIMNPDTYPIVGPEFRESAIAHATRLGWFKDGVLDAPPHIMNLVLGNKGI